MKFAQDFYKQFRDLITITIRNGNVSIFWPKAGEIGEMIKQLNSKLHEIVLKHSPITATQLISIYQKVDLSGLNPDIIKDIKQLIFHYTVTQREEDLVNIDALLEKYNIR